MEKKKILHALFYCAWCEKVVPREEIKMAFYRNSEATYFFHADNHMLEVIPFCKS